VPGPPAVSANDLRRFFAVFAANHQRRTIPSPQERPIPGGVVEERTSGGTADAGQASLLVGNHPNVSGCMVVAMASDQKPMMSEIIA
jgi:hypothetical protein